MGTGGEDNLVLAWHSQTNRCSTVPVLEEGLAAHIIVLIWGKMICFYYLKEHFFLCQHSNTIPLSTECEETTVLKLGKGHLCNIVIDRYLLKLAC